VKIMSRKDPVTRNSQNPDSRLCAFDRESLMYTNGYRLDYANDLPWRNSYELLDSLLLFEWKLADSQQWNFAADYIGKRKTLGVGLGAGLLYGNRGFLGVVQILDTHKWKIIK